MSPQHVVVDSPIGALTVVADGGAITHLLMDAASHRPADPAIYGALGDPGTEPFASTVTQLAEYFAGTRDRFDLPIAPRGNDFQKRVWAMLLEIPYGETRTYGELARALGGPGLAQAVGAANGRNPIAVVVPCHRVIGADGALVGYAGGLDRKRHLLALEEPPPLDGGRLF
ncbi:MAG: methylated-DNA--[protein]-cysteine S-methyltransferase [Terracoccus sp.]